MNLLSPLETQNWTKASDKESSKFLRKVYVIALFCNQNSKFFIRNVTHTMGRYETKSSGNPF